MIDPALDDYLIAPWTPTVEIHHDVVTQAAVTRMAATLDVARPEVVPPLWHWIAFLPDAPTSRLTADGHPQRGGLIPPLRFERRMFAGGHLVHHQPIHVDERLRRSSTVTDVQIKRGRSGELVFVTLRHAIESERGTLLEESNDFVYRDQPPAATASRPSTAATTDVPGIPVHRRVHATPALLFRYSALTFNAHRIHYDERYARDVEGYPSLVVHGPLLATWLAESLCQRHDRPLASFRFRAASPAFLGDDIDLRSDTDPSHDGTVRAIATVDGRLVMSASATLQPDG